MTRQRTVTAATVEHAGPTGEFTSVTMSDEDGDGVFVASVTAYSGLPRFRFTYTLTASTATDEEEDVGTTPTTLFINELMPANDTTFADPQGDYEDWIELYNSGAEAIDMSGIYVSDDPDEPAKWTFPADTTITAGGFLLVWADGDTGDSPGLHASFRLSANGESVVLSDVDERNNALIDRVDFPALEDDEAHGRLPNGFGAFQRVLASPGSENLGATASTLAVTAPRGIVAESAGAVTVYCDAESTGRHGRGDAVGGLLDRPRGSERDIHGRAEFGANGNGEGHTDRAGRHGRVGVADAPRVHDA